MNTGSDGGAVAYTPLVRILTLGRLALEEVRFSRPKPLLLLAFLALEGPKDRRHLSELFWPAAARPMASLRVAVSQVRRAAPAALVVNGNSLGTDLDCDAAELLHDLELAEAAGGPSRYDGAFLGGVDLPQLGPDLEEWVYATREFVAERVREALLSRAERDAGLGDIALAGERAAESYAVPGAAPPEPEQLARIHTLLHAAGHRLVNAVEREAKEFGLELETDRDASRAALLAAVGTKGGSPDNLPAPTREFIGRDPEKIEILSLLDDESVRLTTILGPGGIGKSRLALEVARESVRGGRFRDGVWFVPLESVTRSEAVPDLVARALGISLEPRAQPAEDLAESLTDRSLLLVLDNCEHLPDISTLVLKLLERCPRVQILATSRDHLHVPGEQVFPLEGLEVGGDGREGPRDAWHFDAVALFARRTRRVRPRLELDEAELPYVRALCRRLGGNPLGIELAASLMRVLSPSEIAEQLESNPELLAQPIPGASERHSSLAAVFEHSWELLPATEQDALSRLAAFHGGFSRVAAAEAAGVGIPRLAALVDKSLLRIDHDSRFYRHPLVHEFAQRKLEEQPSLRSEAKNAHARWALQYVSSGTDDVAAWLERMELERENLLAVLRWTLDEAPRVPRADDVRLVGLDLAAQLFRFWYYRTRLREGREWLDKALAVTGDLGELAAAPRSRALHGAGVLANELGDHREAAGLLEERVGLARRLGDKIGEAASLNSLGVIALERRELDRAHELLLHSVKLRREAGREELVQSPLLNLGLVALARDDLAGAEDAFRQSLAAGRDSGDDMGVAISLTNLAIVQLDKRDAGAAVHHLREAVEVYRSLGNKDGAAHCMLGFAAAAALEGRHLRAARLAGAAAAMREAIGVEYEADELARSERHLVTTREALGEAAYLDAWQQGWALDFDAELDQALSR